MSIKLNENYKKLKANYLFSEVAKRVKAYTEANPDKKVIRLGIGDVTRPLTPKVIEALHKATDEMADQKTFRGYAPEPGYDFIREAVAHHYSRFGVSLSSEEIFVGDGAKSDLGNIVEIFGDNEIAIPDPVYPAYVDTNIMSGRKIRFMNATAENGFLPLASQLPEQSFIIYLCSPNNPTGAVYSFEQLTEWVEFANRTGSVIIFDSAYEAYINGNYPHSIYMIPGAKTCAIEICSMSKVAGFTGTRCGWTAMPKELVVDGEQLSRYWLRRQSTKFNGVPYVVQRAAEAALSDEGYAECKGLVSYYMHNATVLADVLTKKGIWFTGGINSPYIWLRCPNNMSSWEFFDYLLNELQIVGTPGVGFGEMGEGYFRLTSFGSKESTEEAAQRMLEKL